MAIESHAPLAITVHRVAHSAGRKTPAHVAAVAVAVAVVSSGLALPLSLVGLVTSVGLLGVVVVKLGAAPLRAALAANAAWRARQQRREARERALAQASSGRVTLADLARLVDEIESRDPDLAQRFDLEALLDRHVALTLAYERALYAVSMGDRGQLERIREGYRSDPEANPKRLELCERRMRCLEQCEAKAEWLADELAILSDTLKLIAQRVACPDDPFTDSTIDRQLAEIDDADAARKQLAAELR